ncbi:hypothetical protein BJ912DRAFT_1043866 [Pholiota molesta]|nr:hypothetical protein BJ912DRAFT_1043866 [Pholiota molesta]
MSKPTPSKSPRIDLNDKPSKEDLLGTLIVVLLKARNLLDKHSFRKSDVFAQAILNGVEKRTHVDIKGGQHPEWDGEVRFPILKSTAAKHRKMEISCYSMEPRSEDLMGKATVDISETLRTGEFDDWVQLEIDGVARGELYLEMTYYANSPAPSPAMPNKLLSAVVNQNTGLNRRPSKLAPAERLSRPHPQTSHPTPGYSQTQGYPKHLEYPQHQPQGNGPSKLSATSNPSRLSNQSAPIRNNHDHTPTMPGGYPDSSSGSPTQPQGNPYTQPQPVPLPTILRPGTGGAASSPTPIPHPQNGLGHGGSQLSSSPPRNPDTRRSSQGSPPNSNPYLGGSASGSQPSSSPPRNPYISGSTTPPKANPYVVGSRAPLPGQLQPGGYSPAVTSQGSITAQLNTTNPSITSPVQSQNPYSGYRLSGQQPTGAPLFWQDNRTVSAHSSSHGHLYFPQPAMAPGRDPGQFGYTDSGHMAHHRTTSGGSALQSLNVGYGQRPPSREDADPYLQTRYQTPLPLPPGAVRSAATGTPTPATQPQQVQMSQATPVYAPPPPPKTPTPTVDKSRLEALRRVEEEAARRHEQEIKDLELAMQLDREFNLQDRT